MAGAGRARRLATALALAALLGTVGAATANAAFPYTRDGGNPQDFTDLYLDDEVPNDVGDDDGGEYFKYSASPDPANSPLINLNPVELGGIRGASLVDRNPALPTGWKLTTGRPDVTIAVMDSGIKWNEAGAMNDLRLKTRLNRGELPVPNHGRAAALDGGKPCEAFADAYDANGDGVFNVRDYACDTRIDLGDSRRVGPAGLLVPQDALIAFSDGSDSDFNGFVDDIAGWDFLDDDNDAFDDVQYGHGTGEAEGSTAEVDNGNTTGTCPNCMSIPMRVGDSFIADVNRFAQAVLYAADNDVQVVQSALGTLNNSSLVRDAVEYAYRHGTTVVVSAADEAAQHNNQPFLPQTILVNSVTRSVFPPPNRSFLAFNGCTNFNAKITLAIPSTSCSSDAVGLASGMAGLVYSAAYNATAKGALSPFPEASLCELIRPNPVSGDRRCLITPNEVRQVMASGRLDPPASMAEGYQADDVNFAGAPPASGIEPSCSPVPAPGCTNPGGPAGLLQAQVDANRLQLAGQQALMRSYPARNGHDQFYGYGRVNIRKALAAVLGDPVNPPPSTLPPNVEIDSPQWFEQVDPERPSLNVTGEVYARGAPFRCQIYVAPGHYPNNRLTSEGPPGDFQPVGGGPCDGSTEQAAPIDGSLGSIDVAALKARFPAETRALGFAGREPGAGPQTTNGRPANDPYGFVVKVVATTFRGGSAITGEDQRAAFLHRDQDMLAGFPKGIVRGAVRNGTPTGDGESSPALADLDGDNRTELIVAGSDGFVHALQRDGSELPGWPVRGDRPPLHTGGRAFASGEVASDRGGAILASVAVGDTNRDGIPEVYAADLEGKVYGWAPSGRRVFTEEATPAFSGKPLQPFVNVRRGETNRTQHGFIASPVLADLGGDDRLEVIAAGMDRHVYAWRSDDDRPGRPGGAADVGGFPLLVVDPSKVETIDSQTHAVTFRADAGSEQQGAIIDTPAVANLVGDARPEIVVGTNEEYRADADGGWNAAPANGASFSLLDQARVFVDSINAQCDDCLDEAEVPLSPANARIYALHPDGAAHGSGQPGYEKAIVPGWPAKLAILNAGLLPVVGEGVSGAPVIGRISCGTGGAGPKVGAVANNGPAYVLAPSGASCYGKANGADVPLQTDFSASGSHVDHPLVPAVGHPALGDLDGTGPSFLAPAAGLMRALDLVLPEYQPSGQDFVAAWSVQGGGQLRPNFPQAVNDLQVLTGPTIADIDGAAGEEIVAGTASKDLAAFNAAGAPVSPRWPKVTTDWTVANPTIGSFGTLDTRADARKVVIGLTRSGYINAYSTTAPACSPGSWPRFHHDNANSGDYDRDAVLPGKPAGLRLDGGRVEFDAPGDDLLCGSARAFQIRTSERPIDEASFGAAAPLGGAPEPRRAGARQSYLPPQGAKRFIAIRATDDQGNVGRVAAIEVGAGGGDGPGRGGGGPCSNRIGGSPGRDRLRGTRGGDLLSGRRGRDSLRGFRGADCLRGNGGRDRLNGGRGRDSLIGGLDQDLLISRDGARDIVNCGRGRRDRARVDRRDRVRGCELVRPRRRDAR